MPLEWVAISQIKFKLIQPIRGPACCPGSLWIRRRAAGLAGSRLGTLTAKLLETPVDHREIVGSTRTSAFVTQFVEASTDRRKIIGCTGSRHISSPIRLFT